MSPRHDDLAVMRFAIQNRDWRLVELLVRLLDRESASWLRVAHDAYTTLSARLG
jgi:hypothetical protein